MFPDPGSQGTRIVPSPVHCRSGRFFQGPEVADDLILFEVFHPVFLTMTLDKRSGAWMLAVLLILAQGPGFRSYAADQSPASWSAAVPTSSGPAYNPLSGPSYPVTQDSYFTDDAGNILMMVNVLGEVARPGQFIVRENADFATLFALSGGLKSGANLGKVVVARREPDRNGKQAYVLDLKSYYRSGDRSVFIALKPNDTVIIPEKGISIEKIARVMGIATPFFYIYDVTHR